MREFLKSPRFVFSFRGATTDEIAAFEPQFWFRLVSRRGWRRVKLEVADDGLEIPGAEPIPVQIDLGDLNNAVQWKPQEMLDGWCWVIFEYRGRTFYGMMLC